MSKIHDKTNIFKAYYGQVSEDARLAGVTDEMTHRNGKIEVDLPQKR